MLPIERRGNACDKRQHLLAHRESKGALITSVRAQHLHEKLNDRLCVAYRRLEEGGILHNEIGRVPTFRHRGDLHIHAPGEQNLRAALHRTDTRPISIEGKNDTLCES